MTEQTASNKSLRKKLVIVALLVAGGGVLGWLGWIELRLKQQQLASGVLSLASVEERIEKLEVAEQRRLAALQQEQEQASRVQSLAEIEARLKALQELQQQGNIAQRSPAEDNEGNATSNLNGKEPARTSRAPSSPLETVITDSAPQSSELASALDKYYLWGLEHRKATLQLQLIKDNILFVVVLTILGFGLYLSYIQFKKGDQPEGSLKLGPAGFEITSSILGIFILAFSIGFFYLYLVHVFQIEEIGQQNAGPAVTPSNQNR